MPDQDNTLLLQALQEEQRRRASRTPGAGDQPGTPSLTSTPPSGTGGAQFPPRILPDSKFIPDALDQTLQLGNKAITGMQSNVTPLREGFMGEAGPRASFLDTVNPLSSAPGDARLRALGSAAGDLFGPNSGPARLY